MVVYLVSRGSTGDTTNLNAAFGIHFIKRCHFVSKIARIVLRSKNFSSQSRISYAWSSNASFLTALISGSTCVFGLLFFWVNQKTGGKRGAKFRGELRPQSRDTAAVLNCVSCLAQPVQLGSARAVKIYFVHLINSDKKNR